MATAQTYRLDKDELGELENQYPNEVRRIVEPQPYAFSHIYQHPTEKWWVFGDNSGRTYHAPTLEAPEGWEAAEPYIEDGTDGLAWWIWSLKRRETVAQF